MADILIISGTNRSNSLSFKISKYYQGLLKKVGLNSEIIDLWSLPEDFIVSALYENSGKNEEFNIYRKKIKDAQKMVFIVPEYNGSFPGVLKAFIDGMEYPNAFRNKIGGLVGLSSGVQGGGLALSHLTDIFNYCGMTIVAVKPKLARIEKHFDGEKITNDLYNELLEEQIELLKKLM